MNYDESYTLYQEGRLLFDQGSYELAITKFKVSIDLYPHFKSMELCGECYLKLNNPAAAVLFLAAATTLNSGIKSQSLLAQAFSDIGINDKAMEIAENVIERSPGNKIAKAILG
jgi:lipopolysaccharide biosynthesis regulator YciM